MLTKTDVWTAVENEVRELLLEDDQEAGALSGHEQLVDLGLNSLMLARLIVALEMALGVDPFAQDVVISDIRTLNDLTTAYQQTLASSAEDSERNSNVA